MRGGLVGNGGRSIGKLVPSTIFNQTLTPFSTFSSGSGRGRGRGVNAPSQTPFSPATPIQQQEDEPNISPPVSLPSGRGRGRGVNPPSQTPFSPRRPIGEEDKPDIFALPPIPSGMGRGRGKIPIHSNPLVVPPFSPASAGQGGPITQQSGGLRKTPVFFKKEDDLEQPHSNVEPMGLHLSLSGLHSSLSAALSGAGRGKPGVKSVEKEKASEENRHTRGMPRPPVNDGKRRVGERRSEDSPPRMTNEEAVKKAMGILSRGGGGGGGVEATGGRGDRGGRGGRGRGRGGRAYRGRGRGGRGSRFQDVDDDDIGDVIKLGDNADGERLAKRLGPEMMAKLEEAFEEMSYRVLPSPADDAYLDALHTNNLIEYEPEYLMGDFDRNPDIDDTPPIPLRDALEKMKPFLMVYEGIKSQEEWEEIIEELMERVPAMKELIDIYSGPDRVTAKQQQQELERVAETLPDSAPSSVKRFTDQAVLSLQSNPGWGFDKKCQFMDKLVWEVSQHYK